MSILFTSFFVSLLGIMIMVGRKVLLLRSGQIIEVSYTHPFMPGFERMKEGAKEKTRALGYTTAVFLIRTYVRSMSAVKEKYRGVREALLAKLLKDELHSLEEEAQEVSGFLQMMSEYKHKIRKLKRRIKEEEGL